MKLNEIAVSKIEEDHKTQDLRSFLNSLGVRNYTIRDDGLVDVDGDVELRRFNFKQIPIQFGHIKGDFDISHSTNLFNLENSPKQIDGNFVINECHNLVSLKGSKETLIMLDFKCTFNSKLTSIEEGPQQVGRNYDLYQCEDLKSLKGIQKRINGYFTCSQCVSLTSFKDGPTHVDGDFSANNCRSLDSLNFLPKEIKGEFFIGKLSSRVKYYLVPIFNVKGITKIRIFANSLISAIMTEHYLSGRDMLNCQDELIESGFEQYAEVE